jgi:S1-C subfamily serine protease
MMHTRITRPVVVLLLFLLLVACGPAARVEPTPTTAPEPTAAPESIAAPSLAMQPLAITRREDVKLGVVQIVSRGTFVPPGESASQSAGGSGSGFVIDPEGIVVTNNHVVSGAALIEVYIDGESEPRNARVLGVSECSDLAVIDLEGDNYPFLEWYEGDVSAGMDVYSAGFPLGDPKFTLTKGVVLKEQASGETDRASVERVIEHDATIRPGNSGGPLVDEAGQVVAVNYAGLDGGPYYAIGRDEALGLIGQLRDGENVTWLGLNGQAIKLNEVSGIWIWSVESGSPADRARLRPGDLITRLEGLEMAGDGTLADYCQVLRSRDPGDTLTMEVYRPTTDELLEGQINGRELEVVAAGSPEPVAGPTAAPTAAPVQADENIIPLDLGGEDITAARQALDDARGQYSELIFETFDRGNRTRRSWEENEQSILRDNFYRLIVSEASTIRPVFWAPDGQQHALGADYIIEVDVALDTKGAIGGVGLSFDGQGAGNYLTFVIRSDNTWQVISFVNDEQTETVNSGAIPSSAIIGGVNQLRVWREPDAISLWINNTPVGIIGVSPFEGGQVGVAAFGGDDVNGPITLIMDNFRVLTK